MIGSQLYWFIVCLSLFICSQSESGPMSTICGIYLFSFWFKTRRLLTGVSGVMCVSGDFFFQNLRLSCVLITYWGFDWLQLKFWFEILWELLDNFVGALVWDGHGITVSESPPCPLKETITRLYQGIHPCNGLQDRNGSISLSSSHLWT